MYKYIYLYVCMYFLVFELSQFMRDFGGNTPKFRREFECRLVNGNAMRKMICDNKFHIVDLCMHF